MGKVTVGDKAHDFTFSTPWKEFNQFYNVLVNKKTVLLFLRFYGCTVCQLDIANFIAVYEKIKSMNSQVLVVLQTEPWIIREQVLQEEMPLTIVCDPEHEIFKLYCVEPGKSENDILSEETIKKINQAREKGIKKIENRGKEDQLQLPATFIIESNGTISFALFGTHGADIPSADEVIAML